MALASRLPLSERTRPTRLTDVVGNPRAVAELRAWADRWRSGLPAGHRAALLFGPPGVGKTSAALALAAELGWPVVEMNASDARNEAAIERVAGRASITHPLLDRTTGDGPSRTLIVLDEADSLSGRATESPRPAPTPLPLREFLRGRYGGIEALNAAWGLVPKEKPLPFESWDAVPRTPGNHAWARRSAARRDLEDWRGAARPRDESDRGGMAAMARLVRSTRQPIVMIVNDERVLTRYSAVFRTSVARIRFYPLRDRELGGALSAIARRERIELAPGALESIVQRSRGDLRAAVNDLDAIAPLPAGPRQLEVLAGRDLASDFAAVTEEVLTSARFYRSIEIRDRLDAPPDDLLPWIEENVPHFAPDPQHRAAALDRLAAAEHLLARARRWRIWGLWSYASEVLTGGVGLAVREAPAPSERRAYFPGFLGEMGRSRATRGVRDAVARKAGRHLHLSRAKARESVLPLLDELFAVASDRRASARALSVARALAHELELTPEEVAYLARADPSAPVVARVLAPSEVEGPRETPTSRERRGPRRVQRDLSEFGGR